MSKFYFILALIDCFLGYIYLISGSWYVAGGFFLCAFLLSLGITKEEKEDDSITRVDD